MGRLAEELGIHRESLSRLRSGEIEQPKFPVVAKLFKLANRSLDQLVGIEIGVSAPLTEEERAELRREREERIRLTRIIDRWLDEEHRQRQALEQPPAVEDELAEAAEGAAAFARGHDTAEARADLVDAMQGGEDDEEAEEETDKKVG